MNREQLPVPVIVIKVGGNIAVSNNAKENISEHIARIWGENKVVLISSGAIKTALHVDEDFTKADLEKLSLPQRQRLALIGQPVLMKEWTEQFKKFGLFAGQALTDKMDLRSKNARANLSNVIWECFKSNTVPIFNGNDAVAIEEIIYGDNDFLAVELAKLLKAKMLLFVTEPTRLIVNGKELSRVSEITEDIRKAVKNEKPNSMKSKIEVIDKCLKADIIAIFCAGFRPHDIWLAVNDFGSSEGTYFW